MAMNGLCTTGEEHLLRGLAAGDERSLQSILAVSPAGMCPHRVPRPGGLAPSTSALVHLAGMLAAGGSTTSLRWAVELATQAGVRDEEIVEVLATVAAIVGSARVVAAAPRLALAIGYDIEVEGWDGY
jgi:4-carboxymuconolactone decarboxylase